MYSKVGFAPRCYISDLPTPDETIKKFGRRPITKLKAELPAEKFC